MDPNSIRGRLERALAGEPVGWPVYAVYDWFVKNRTADWPSLFARGLGQIAHVDLVRVERPHLEIVERREEAGGRSRRTTRWLTDRGELEETFEGEWQRSYLVKSPADYRVLRRAFEDTRYEATAEPFLRSEAGLGDGGLTLGALGWTPLRRSPLLQVQVDFAGPERFALDLADEAPELMDLLELLTDLTLRKLREAVRTPARFIKLWENLAIETLGPPNYRRWLVPLYRKIIDLLSGAGKRLLVHYDGKLRAIAPDIAGLDFDIDSLTPPPEGDMTAAEARAAWPEKFLWLHPPLGWYDAPRQVLKERVRRMVREAGPRNFCLMISEDLPANWREQVPAVLEALEPTGAA
jgi:hypothetical protein